MAGNGRGGSTVLFMEDGGEAGKSSDPTSLEKLSIKNEDGPQIWNLIN